MTAPGVCKRLASDPHHQAVDNMVFFRPVCKKFSHLTLMGDNQAFQHLDFVIQIFKPIKVDGASSTVVVGAPLGPPKACRVSGCSFNDLATQLLVWRWM